MSEYVNSLVPLSVQLANAEEGNRVKQFKWLSHIDRVKRIDVNISHKIRRIDIAPTVHTAGMKKKEIDRATLHASFFGEEMVNAKSKDKTKAYTKFHKEISKYTMSLPLILHFKEKIITIFIKHLTIPNTPALQTLLDLFPHLARDLRHEMFPHFGEILDALISVVDPNNSVVLEASFSCIGYIFKYLIRSLVTRVDDVYFGYYITLLAHERSYVRDFAAQSLGYVLRKVSRNQIRQVISRFLSLPTLQCVSDNVLLREVGEVDTHEKDDDGDDSDSDSDSDNDDVKEVSSKLKKQDVEAVFKESEKNIKNTQIISNHTVASIEWNDRNIANLIDGLGSVLFNVVKNVQSGFHSISDRIFPIIYSLLSMKSKLIRHYSFAKVVPTEEHIAQHGSKKAAKKFLEDDLALRQMDEQQTFRIKVVMAMTGKICDYTNTEKSQDYFNHVSTRMYSLVHKWRKINGKLDDVTATMSDSDSDSDSDNDDDELYGRREHHDDDEFDVDNSNMFDDVADDRRRHQPETSGSVSRELVYMMGVVQAFVCHRHGLIVRDFNSVADVALQLIDPDLLHTDMHKDYPIYMFHAIALFTQVWCLSSNITVDKGPRNTTQEIKETAIAAYRSLALALPDMLALQNQPYVFTYLIGSIRRFLPVEQFQQKVMPKILTNISTNLNTANKSALHSDIDEVFTSNIALLSVVLAPIPSHNVIQSKHFSPLSPVASFNEIITQIQWLTNTYCPESYIDQQHYPSFVRNFCQYRYNQLQSLLMYDKVDEVEDPSYNYIDTGILTDGLYTIVQQLCQSLLISTHSLVKKMSAQTISTSWAILQVLIGMFPDPTRSISVIVPGKKKPSTTTVNHVLYTAYVAFQTVFDHHLYSLDGVATTENIEGLGHVLGLVEAAMLGLSRASDCSREDEEDVSDDTLVSLLTIPPHYATAVTLPSRLAQSLEFLTPSSTTTLSTLPHKLLYNAFVDVALSNMTIDKNGSDCIAMKSIFGESSTSTIYNLQTVVLKRLTGILNECSSRLDMIDKSSSQLLLDDLKFWDKKKNPLDNENVDSIHNSAIVDIEEESDNDDNSELIDEINFNKDRISKKRWNKLKNSDKQAAIDAKKPKIDKDIFLSAVDKLRKERKMKDAAELEASISKIVVPSGLSNSQKRAMISGTLKNIRSKHMEKRKQRDDEMFQLVTHLQQEYSRVSVIGALTSGLSNLTSLIFETMGDKSCSNDFQTSVFYIIAPFLSSPVLAIRSLAVNSICSFPMLHYLREPHPREGEEVGLVSNKSNHHHGQSELMSDLFTVVNLPPTIHNSKAVIVRLDNIFTAVETRLLPLEYVNLLTPFALSIFSLHMSLYFEPARKIIVSLANNYPSIAWPWLSSYLSDMLLHSHIVEEISHNAIKYGALTPCIPSHQLIEQTKASKSVVIDTSLVFESETDVYTQRMRDVDISPVRQASALSSMLSYQFKMYNYVELQCGSVHSIQKELFTSLIGCNKLLDNNKEFFINVFSIFLRSEFSVIYPIIDTPLLEYSTLKRQQHYVTLDTNGFYHDVVSTSREYYDSLPKKKRSEDMLVTLQDLPPTQINFVTEYRKIAISKMSSFLRILRNMKKIHELPIAHTIIAPLCVRLLNFPDLEIPTSSLYVLNKLKLDYVTPYVPFLERLLDEKQFRNALVSLNVAMLRSVDDSKSNNTVISNDVADKVDDEAQGIYGVDYVSAKESKNKMMKKKKAEKDDVELIVIQPHHRAMLAPIIISIINYRLYGTSGKKGEMLDARRNAIASFLLTIPSQELLPFISFLMRPFLMVMLRGTGNTGLLDQVYKLVVDNIAVSQAPYGTALKDTLVIPAATSPFCPSVFHLYSSSSYFKDTSAFYASQIQKEFTLIAVMTRLIFTNGSSMLTGIMKTIPSGVNDYLLSMDSHDEEELHSLMPISTNAHSSLVKSLFNQDLVNQKTDFIEIMNINAPFSVSQTTPLSPTLPRYIFPEIQIAKQMSFIDMVNKITDRLRTGIAPFLPSLFSTVLHLYTRVVVRLARVNELSVQRRELIKSKLVDVMLVDDVAMLSENNDEDDDEEEPVEKSISNAQVAQALSEETEEEDAAALSLYKKQSADLRSIRKSCLTFVSTVLEVMYPMFGLDVVKATAPKKSVKAKLAANITTPDVWALTNSPIVIPLVDTVDAALSSSDLYTVTPRIMYNYTHMFLQASMPSLSRFGNEGIYSRGGLLEVICALARHRSLQPILALPHNYDVLPFVFSALSSHACDDKVAFAILEIMEHLINTRDQLLAEKQEALDEALLSADRENDDMIDSDEEALNASDDDDDDAMELSSDDESSDSDRSSESEDDMSDDDDSYRQRTLKKFGLNQYKSDNVMTVEERHALARKDVTPIEDSKNSINLLEVLESLISKHASVFLHHLNNRMQMLANIYTPDAGVLSLDHVREAKRRLSHAQLPKREFELAQKLCPFVNDSETAQTLLSILYPYLPIGNPRPPYSLEATGGFTNHKKEEIDTKDMFRKTHFMDHRLIGIFKMMKLLIPVIKDNSFLISFQNALATQFLLVFNSEARGLLVDVINSIANTSISLTGDSDTSALLPQDIRTVLEKLVATEQTRRLAIEADFNSRSLGYNALRAEDETKFQSALVDEFIEQPIGDIVDVVTMSALPDFSKEKTVNMIDVDGQTIADSVSKGVGRVRHIHKYNVYQCLHVVYSVLHDIYSNEFAIRENAIVALLDMIETNIGYDEDLDSPSKLMYIIHNHVISNLPNIRFHLPRRHYMDILGALGRRFASQFPAYAILCDEDPDLDFFSNIMHIQSHCRTLALRRVCNIIEKFVQEAKTDSSKLNVVTDIITPQYNFPLCSAVPTLLYPIALTFISEVDVNAIKDARSTNKRKKYRKKAATNLSGVDHSLLEQAITACGLLGSLMHWRHYQFRLTQLFKMITSRHALERLYLRAACAILDKFPFDMGVSASHLASSALVMADQVQENLLNRRERGEVTKKLHIDDLIGSNGEKAQSDVFEHITDAITTGDEDALASVTLNKTDSKIKRSRAKGDVKKAAVPAGFDKKTISSLTGMDAYTGTIDKNVRNTIRRHLGSRILPKLFAFCADVKMDNTSTKHDYNEVESQSARTVGAMRVGVVMAAVKLLQRMGVVEFHVHFPKMVRVICAQLARKEIEFRVAARKTLVNVLNNVGPAFLFYIVNELHHCLTDGYQLHVLGNSLNLCLSTVKNMSTFTNGQIDYCLPSILPLLKDDLLGPVSEEKMVDALAARYPEVKAVTAPQSFFLIAEMMQFYPTITALTSVLAKELSIDRDGKPPTLVTSHKIAYCMQYIVKGLRYNTTVKQEDLLYYVHTILRSCTGYDDDVRKLRGEEVVEDEMSDDSDSDSSDDDSSDDDGWYDGEPKKKKKAKNYTGVLYKQPKSQTKIVGNVVVGGKVIGGGTVYGKKKTFDETFALHPSLGGTTWRSKVEEPDKSLSNQPATFTDDIKLCISSDSDSNGNNFNGGSCMLMFGLDLLMTVVDDAKYTNIKTLLGMEDFSEKATAQANITADPAVILSMLEPLPGLMNKAIFLMDRGHNAAKRDVGNACGGLDAQKIKEQLNKYKARSSQVIITSLKVTSKLLRIPLEAWEIKECDQLKKLSRFVILTLTKTPPSSGNHSSNAGGSVMERQLERFSRDNKVSDIQSSLRLMCFSILSNGYNYNSNFSLTDEQIQILIPIIQLDLVNTKQGVGAFMLLQCLFDKQVMVPEIYDIATQCCELVVRSYDPIIRERSASIFFNFLINYPLNAKRQEQHLSFLINNLSYDIPGGRQGVIRLLQHIVAKFPFAYIEKYAEVIFLPVCLQLHNDTDATCKDMLNTLLTSFFRRLSGSAAIGMTKEFHREQWVKHKDALIVKRGQLCATTFTWLTSKQMNLVRMGCYVIGIIATAMGSEFAAYCEKLVTVLNKILKGSVAMMLQQTTVANKAIIEAKKALRGAKYDDDDVTVMDTNDLDDDLREMSYGQFNQEASGQIVNRDGVSVDGEFVKKMEVEDNDDDELDVSVSKVDLDDEDDDMNDEDEEEPVQDTEAMDDVDEDDEDDEDEEVEPVNKRVKKDVPHKDVDETESSVKPVLRDRIGEVVDNTTMMTTAEVPTAPWHMAYTALTCLDKVWSALPAMTLPHITKHQVWINISTLCLHPHNWVRQASAKTIYSHLRQCDLTKMHDSQYRTSSTVFTTLETLFDAAKTVALQYNSQFIDEKLSEYLVHNLSFLTLAMYVSRDDPYFVEYAQRVRTTTVSSVTENKIRSDNNIQFIHPGMNWVFSNVSFLARQTTNMYIKTAVFKFFKEIALAIPGEHLASFLIAIINPLYRVLDSPMRVSKYYRIMGRDNNFMQQMHNKCKSAANELTDVLKKTCTAPVFLSVYNTIHRKVTEVRTSRNQKTKQFALNNPAAFREKTQRKNLVSRKKRKDVKNFAFQFKK